MFGVEAKDKKDYSFVVTVIDWQKKSIHLWKATNEKNLNKIVLNLYHEWNHHYFCYSSIPLIIQ